MHATTTNVVEDNPDGSITLHLRVIPNAKQTRVDGIIGAQLKIRIHAPPVDGKANKEVICFLAKTLKIRKSQVRITAGETARDKKVQINGASAKMGLIQDLLHSNSYGALPPETQTNLHDL